MAPSKRTELSQIAELIKSGHDSLREDFNRKHEENRAALNLEGRITRLETQLASVVGEGPGGSGLLHEIDRKVDGMRDEVTAIKKSIEDAPAMRKWVFMAAGVVLFLGVVVPIIVAVVVALLSKH